LHNQPLYPIAARWDAPGELFDGVSFEEAATAFSDSMAATGVDPDYSITEERYVTFIWPSDVKKKNL